MSLSSAVAARFAEHAATHAVLLQFPFDEFPVADRAAFGQFADRRVLFHGHDHTVVSWAHDRVVVDPHGPLRDESGDDDRGSFKYKNFKTALQEAEKIEQN